MVCNIYPFEGRHGSFSATYPQMRPYIEGAPVLRPKTFADKFSKFKSRLLFSFWTLLIGAILYYSFNFLSALYSVTLAQDSYYTIEVKNDLAFYTRVKERPAKWIPLNKISKRIQQAIVSSEDGKFYIHPGYDLEELQDAIHETFVLKKKMRGASTITQQLVKNLYLNRDRTFGRKAKELILAIMIEKYADKQKILEMYLNIIEYGKGLYGIEAAAKYYFKKSPAAINAREAAFLAMLLPSPKKYSRSFKTKTLSRYAERTVASILLKMRMSGYISQDEYQTMLVSRFSWEKAPAIEAPPVIESIEDQSVESNDEFSDEEIGHE